MLGLLPLGMTENRRSSTLEEIARIERVTLGMTENRRSSTLGGFTPLICTWLGMTENRRSSTLGRVQAPDVKALARGQQLKKA